MKAVVFLLLLHACLSSHRVDAGRIPTLSDEPTSTRRILPAATTCPAGVVCPTGASCVVDRNGYPFCKCAAGQAIINGVCAPAVSWAEVGTSVVIYNRGSYANNPTSLAPAVLRGPAPNTSACVNLPAAFNGTVGSLRILWNVNDGVPDHLVCGKLFFWDKPNCCCSGSGWAITASGGWTNVNPNNFSYTATSIKTATGVVATGRSISCQAAVAPPTAPPPPADPCATTTCPANATCSVVNSAAVCTCKTGLTMVSGKCVAPDPCTGYSCPAFSVCSNVNGAATCTCTAGYEMVNGQCVVPNPCATANCPLNSVCSSANGVATCTCSSGFQMVNGQCAALPPADPCASTTCPANATCSVVNGAATCTCLSGFQMTSGQCIAPNPCAGYSCPAFSLCSNVNGAATCTCTAGYQMVNGQCVVPVDPCLTTTCPAKATCTNVNGAATCKCAVGFTMTNGACQPADPCSLATCPAGCTCSSTTGVAKCSCADLCYGVKCPDVSTCTLLGGAPVCKCPAPYTRLIDSKCSSATLANSEYLDNHNAARAAVGAVPMVWNTTLATNALAWATALTNSTYNCGLVHGGNAGQGQNLAGASPSGWAAAGTAVGWWVGEGKMYSWAVFNTATGAGCSTGNWADCGHYTQVIWNNTKSVGCAKASCGTGSDVWACNYYPPGNYGGQLPYVQDPCYRVACPSTSSCTVRYSKPVCVCPVGQVLVNNASCQPDPCSSGATTCQGNLVCDGSSGAAQCACPAGLVSVAADKCVPPACVGSTCPANAECAVDGSGYPFCQCAAGSYLLNNVCTAGPAAAIAVTSLALYNAPNYVNAPVLVRAGVPASPATCVNIPASIAGNVSSLRVLWNVPDASGATKQSCGLLWFWNAANCYGSATGYYRPGNDLTVFATTSGNVATVRAIACAP